MSKFIFFFFPGSTIIADNFDRRPVQSHNSCFSISRVFDEVKQPRKRKMKRSNVALINVLYSLICHSFLLMSSICFYFFLLVSSRQRYSIDFMCFRRLPFLFGFTGLDHVFLCQSCLWSFFQFSCSLTLPFSFFTGLKKNHLFSSIFSCSCSSFFVRF